MPVQVKQRQSNFELLRMVCMLMVISAHAKLGGMPEVTQADIHANPSLSFLWVLVNQVLVICVDVFVMISGWFGIKASWKGVGKLLFQVFFITLLCTLVCAAFGVKVINGGTFACFVGAGYWFVPAYLVLYAVSPALNMFIQQASQKTYINVLILFFSCEFIYGYFFTMGSFDRGFSPMSFVGLYLLAAYIRKYPNKLTTLSKGWDFVIWFGITIMSVLIFYFGNKYLGVGFHLNHNYSPLVIAASVYFLLGFSKINMGYNKFINWCGASAFAIYLVHENNLVKPYYAEFKHYLFENLSLPRYFAVVIPAILAISLACILIDKLRVFVWNKLARVRK